MKKTNKIATIDGKDYPVFIGVDKDLFVKYQNRSRLIQFDELGDSYIESKYWTIKFIIKTVISPSSVNEGINGK